MSIDYHLTRKVYSAFYYLSGFAWSKYTILIRRVLLVEYLDGRNKIEYPTGRHQGLSYTVQRYCHFFSSRNEGEELSNSKIE